MSCVDVVIPCYNYGRFLGQCVNSVVAQLGVEVRVLIIDDCSTDSTEEVGCNLARGNPFVTFRRHVENRGHIQTYNEGLLEWATSDYVVLLSADDMLASGSLKRAVSVMDTHKTVAYCYGSVEVFTHAPVSKAFATPGSTSVLVRPGSAFWDEVCSAGYNPVATPSVVVRLSSQRAAGGYRPDLPHSGDLHMWLSLAARGEVAQIQHIQAFWRKHGANMNAAYAGPTLPDAVQRLAAFEAAWAEVGALVASDNSLIETARAAVAWSVFWAASRALDERDVRLCDDCLAFAEHTHPLLRETREWRRLLLKRRLSRVSIPIARAISKLTPRRGRL